MPTQTQLFPEPPPPAPKADPEGSPATSGSGRMGGKSAPVWLQRMSLCVLVLFCLYLGVLVTALPWWTRVWDENPFFFARPRLNAFLHLGAVRGAISGLGLLDIWIGISEAVHYREYRAGK